ncbi:MAG: ABC transporter ATP-binding protein [Candidatus Omnitrophica bacterium]|nr:ABC transporter ATP-binding protein [Candidatus Omnitrophota bacterium]
MKKTMIKASGLTKVYIRGTEEVYAVNSINLEINDGDFIALMGPSGSGKTTLLDLIGCLDNVSSGRLEVFGKDVSKVKENSLVGLRRGHIGFIFQEFLLIPSLTAIENVELSLYFARRPQDRKKLLQLFEKVGLAHRVDHLPKEMSGGERQRTAIARALAVSPKFLIADEPTGNLDTRSSQEIFDIFKKINKEEGLTIILATHNPKLGSQADRIIYLKDGKIVSKEESSLY